jgi:hypothetical protein
MAPHSVMTEATQHVAVQQSNGRVTFEETVYAAMAAPKRPATAARSRPVSARTRHTAAPPSVNSATHLIKQGDGAVQTPSAHDHLAEAAAAPPALAAEASTVSAASLKSLETAAAAATRKKRPLSARPKRLTTASSSVRRPQSAQTRQHEPAATPAEECIVPLPSTATQHLTAASQQSLSSKDESGCDASSSEHAALVACDAQPTAAAAVADAAASSTPRASILRSQSADRKRSAGLTAAAAARTRKSILSRRPSSAPQQSLQLNIQPAAAAAATDAAIIAPRSPRTLRLSMRKQLYKPDAQSQLLRTAETSTSSTGKALHAVAEQQQQQQKCTGAQEPSLIDLGGSTAMNSSNGASPHPPNSTSATAAAARPRSATTVRQQHKQQQQRAASAGAKRQPPPVSILGLDLELIVVTESNSNQQQQQQQSRIVASSDSARRASGGRLALAFTIGMPMCAAFWPRVRPRIPAALRKGGGMLRSRMKGIVIGLPRPRAGLTVSKRRPYVDKQGDPFEGGW